MTLIEVRKEGLYCPVGNFYIDPHRIVETAIITHAHTDHGSTGHKTIISHPITNALLETRYPGKVKGTTLEYGEVVLIKDVAVSLHPAGHVPGSAQVRVSYKGETWVVSGDYKRVDDLVSTAFEVVPCDVFITESTFGLPNFIWEKEVLVFEKIHDWWQNNKKQGKTSILLGYSLGKAQRLLAKLDKKTGSISVHPSIAIMNSTLRSNGVRIPDVPTHEEPLFSNEITSLIVAPPASMRGKWMKQIGKISIGYVSGWMAMDKTPWYIRTDAKFALSDHADFPGLLQTVHDTGAQKIYTMHGFAKEFAGYLKTLQFDAEAIEE
jgi:putative mRNA 3-end processing factor